MALHAAQSTFSVAKQSKALAVDPREVERRSSKEDDPARSIRCTPGATLVVCEPP
jgi:hypothetical protein